jgi:hypothetical protein
LGRALGGEGIGGRYRGDDGLAMGRREFAARVFDVRLAEPVQARALLGRRRTAKTDRLDARSLARLVAKEMLPESWIQPEEIQRLRDRNRLRKTLAEDQRRWGQRLHAFLLHEGWPCAKSRLLTPGGCAGSVRFGWMRMRGCRSMRCSP